MRSLDVLARLDMAFDFVSVTFDETAQGKNTVTIERAVDGRVCLGDVPDLAVDDCNATPHSVGASRSSHVEP
jgi:hypothetical protein